MYINVHVCKLCHTELSEYSENHGCYRKSLIWTIFAGKGGSCEKVEENGEKDKNRKKNAQNSYIWSHLCIYIKFYLCENMYKCIHSNILL